MHVLVAYDIQRDNVREKVRRLLWRYGLCPISKSVYAGRLTRSRMEVLARRLSEVVCEGDSIILVPLQDHDFFHALSVTKNKVWRRGEERDVIVVGEDS